MEEHRGRGRPRKEEGIQKKAFKDYKTDMYKKTNVKDIKKILTNKKVLIAGAFILFLLVGLYVTMPYVNGLKTTLKAQDPAPEPYDDDAVITKPDGTTIKTGDLSIGYEEGAEYLDIQITPDKELYTFYLDVKKLDEEAKILLYVEVKKPEDYTSDKWNTISTKEITKSEKVKIVISDPEKYGEYISAWDDLNGNGKIDTEEKKSVLGIEYDTVIRIRAIVYKESKIVLGDCDSCGNANTEPLLGRWPITDITKVSLPLEASNNMPASSVGEYNIHAIRLPINFTSASSIDQTVKGFVSVPYYYAINPAYAKSYDYNLSDPWVFAGANYWMKAEEVPQLGRKCDGSSYYEMVPYVDIPLRYWHQGFFVTDGDGATYWKPFADDPTKALTLQLGYMAKVDRVEIHYSNTESINAQLYLSEDNNKYNFKTTKLLNSTDEIQKYIGTICPNGYSKSKAECTYQEITRMKNSSAKTVIYLGGDKIRSMNFIFSGGDIKVYDIVIWGEPIKGTSTMSIMSLLDDDSDSKISVLNGGWN